MDASTIWDDDVVYYLAASIDGFIAGKDGDVSWLNDYFVPELGFHSFMERVKGAIMGRGTWDKMVGMTGGGSAYGETPCTIATNRPLEVKEPVQTASGTPAEILAAAQRKGTGPFWLVGGADLATQFLAAGVLTRIDLFTIPLLLGSGIPAFRNDKLVKLDLESSGTYPKGITRTTWRLPAA